MKFWSYGCHRFSTPTLERLHTFLIQISLTNYFKKFDLVQAKFRAFIDLDH
ncbi:hypothetical protein PAMC26577_08595 [Caballeronia sordidicola]|uniref:Uncharacterized protein n=1 Tax=Caballeronia sordidicola TaxID=196367 RepID=A0A242N004_CABSO|nr:hypothetical protein PAMC26577_08595 [Caballeronia sordidicola]